MNRLSCEKPNELLKKKKKGFTLVELIIVIAIIAILAAIAIPKFGEIRNSANAKSDVATAKNIATVVASKIADNADPATYDDQEAIASLITIDGSLTPKVTGKTAFVIRIDSGNISIDYKEGGRVYPAS